MFARLLKYDFRSMLKQFGMIWLAALALAFINSFTLSGFDSTSTTGETVASVSIVVYVAIMIAMFVVTMIFVIQRFYKGLLGDEGYLMHTLPAESWELIASKLVCAVAVTVVSIIVAILSIFVICRPMIDLDGVTFFRVFRWLWKNFDSDVLNACLILAECLILLLVGTAQSYLLLYLAMAVGHLFNKHRAAMSVAAYIAIQTFTNTLHGIVGEPVFRILSHLFWDTEGWRDMHVMFWLLIALTAAVAAVYFFFTDYILKNKLNLE